jgi:3-carboxy-cis,cis-muconate cycloisomerase
MRPSSSTSKRGLLLRPLVSDPAVEVVLGDDALVRAMLRVEAALATVQAELGLVPADAAAVIVEVAGSLVVDVADLGRRSVAAGNPVSPLLAELREALPEHARAVVHRGTTSQDVLDTALMLLARDACTLITERLDEGADAVATLAREHRTTPMVGRTLGQQALPTTFGRKAAGWLVALDEAGDRLREVGRRRLAVQLGGAVGTLADLDGGAATLAARLAAELGLVEPVLPWHTDRGRVLELAAAAAAVVAAAGKVALDLVLLAQTEVAEVRPGAGGTSTAMPHKQNPADAVAVRSAALRAPGLLATLFTAAAQQEHERGAGAWHAEWEPLRDLLSLAGGSVMRLRAALTTATVDPERMRADLDQLADSIGRGPEFGPASVPELDTVGGLVDRALAAHEKHRALFAQDKHGDGQGEP